MRTVTAAIHAAVTVRPAPIIRPASAKEKNNDFSPGCLLAGVKIFTGDT
jgi:hypothetical protein